jgi:hypothetical protein
MKFPVKELTELKNKLGECGVGLEGVVLSDGYMFEELFYLAPETKKAQGFGIYTSVGLVNIYTKRSIVRNIHEFLTSKIGEWNGV